MNTLIIISLILITIISCLIWLKKIEILEEINHLIFIILVLVLALNGFENQASGLRIITFLISILSLNWLFSRVFKKKFAIVFGILSLMSLMIFEHVELNFLAYPIMFDLKNSLLIPIFTIFIFGVQFLVNKFISKKDNQLTIASEFILLGLLILFSVIFSGNFGLFILGTSYAVLSNYFKTKNHYYLPIFGLAFIVYFFKLNEIASNTILQVSSLTGLFIGIGLFYLINIKNEGLSIFKKIIYLILAIFITLGSVYIEKIKEHTGGMNALLGIFLTFIVLFSTLRKENKSIWVGFMSFLIVLTFFANVSFPSAKNTKIDDFEMFEEIEEASNEPNQIVSDSLQKSNGVNIISDTLKALNPLLGKWEISENSKIKFELGPTDARTQGEFQLIKGSIYFDENPSKNELNVALPLANFTTFNDYRDQTLMEKDFLNRAVQEILLFNSSKWKQNGKNFQVVGDFKMKNILQKMPIIIKVNGFKNKNKTLLISGKSTLDRTKFDMSSDPKIGDIVDFNFQLILKRVD
jgi:polyisoprenoid-binding protein YceI